MENNDQKTTIDGHVIELIGKDQISILENPSKKPETKERAKGKLNYIVRNIERFLEVTGQSVSKKFPSTSAENDRKEFLLFFEVAKNLQALPELKKKLERREKAEKKAREQREAKSRAYRLEYLKDWRAGKSFYAHGNSFEGEPVYLRVDPVPNTEGFHKEIQTSKGARVSYTSGKLLYQAIKAGHDVKGYDIEGYTVISVNGTLKIGCHEIDMKEVNRFARKEGWI